MHRNRAGTCLFVFGSRKNQLGLRQNHRVFIYYTFELLLAVADFTLLVQPKTRVIDSRAFASGGLQHLFCPLNSLKSSCCNSGRFAHIFYICPQAAHTTYASETWAVQDAFPHLPSQHQFHKVPLKRQRRCRNSSQVGSANAYPNDSWDPGTSQIH
eukprot:3091074-Amphidinium_carterae.1